MQKSKMLSDLRLTDFRCFERLRFEPAPGTNFLIGANAQGKTSILEAVCVVTRLQSPRTSTLADLLRHGRPGTAIDAHIASTGDVPKAASTGGDHTHGAHLHFRYEPPKRMLTLDSVPQSASAEYLTRSCGIAWFSNDDIEIVRGSASRRRRAIDFLCSQLEPTYSRRLRAYDRALRSRNALLKDGRPRREIEAFDPVLAEHGNFLVAARTEAATAASPLLTQAVRDIGGREEIVSSRYVQAADGPLQPALAASRAEETRLRQTLVGPHRDDLSIELNEMDASKFASEGQQRTLAVALKLAHTRLIMERTGRTPLLLIDDVFGELDPDRRQNLLAHLPQNSQRLITTTHLDWLAPSLRGTVFRLSSHQLSPINHQLPQ